MTAKVCSANGCRDLCSQVMVICCGCGDAFSVGSVRGLSFEKILMVVLLFFVPPLGFSGAWISFLPLVDWNMAKHGPFLEWEEGSEGRASSQR